MLKKAIKVFIVDDHQIMIDGIKSMLSNVAEIVVVGHANNGQEAIHLLRNLDVDVVIMDVEMPIMNGIDATKYITSSYSEMKVIALTTYDEKSIIQTMFSAGAKGYILKNINRRILVEAICSVAEGGVFQGSDVSIAIAKKSMLHNQDDNIYSQSQATSLSSREVEILKHLVNGLSNKEIADLLYISPKTVETHRTNMMKKLKVHNIASLVKYAIKTGLVD
jgi:DNA-binding NarL/FixJ family response regulator